MGSYCVFPQLALLPHSVPNTSKSTYLFLSFGLEAAHLDQVHSGTLSSACKHDIGVLYTISCTMPAALLAFEVIIWFKSTRENYH